MKGVLEPKGSCREIVSLFVCFAEECWVVGYDVQVCCGLNVLSPQKSSVDILTSKMALEEWALLLL